jgi:DNA-binding NarL/FixJ family response regulator
MSAGLRPRVWPADRMLESLPCTQVARLLDAEGVWRELASGFRAVVSATDVAKSRHATLARVESPAALDWRRLSEREQSVVSWAARGLSQKVVALELGLATSTVSSTLRSAREHTGFASSVAMLRAWRAAAACGAPLVLAERL